MINTDTNINEARLIQGGLAFIHCITECYGAEDGIKLWEQISTVIDPTLKGKIFFAMITGDFNNKITARISNANTYSKVEVIKAIRNVSGFGLKEAKDLVDSAPKPVKEGVKKEEAAEIKAKLEAVGATVSVK